MTPIVALTLPPSLQVVLDAVNDILRRMLMLPEQASTVAVRTDALQYVELAIYTAISIVYIGTAVVFLLRYRRGGSHAYVAQDSAPGLLLAYSGGVFTLFALFWYAGYVQFRHIRTPPADARDVYVTAKQWVWKFAYADGGASLDVLYVPVGRPIRLLLTSRDVIHSFWVPAFRLKQDAVPGTYTSLWFEATSPGTYQVMCAQMCGTGHSRMWAQIVVLDAAGYDRWRRGEAPEVDAATAAPPFDLVEAGRRAAVEYGCLRCHTVDGQPHIGPTWFGAYGSEVRLEGGGTVPFDPAYITESMMDPTAKIVRGYPAVMPSYAGLIEPAQTAAIVEYIKSLGAARAPAVVAPPPAGPIDGIGPRSGGPPPRPGRGGGPR